MASTTAGLRDLQQQLCCDALVAVGPDAPTLCAGWTARDLAVHLWQLNHDPLAWLGMLPGFDALGRARSRRVKARLDHAAVVAEVRQGPGRFRCMPDDHFGDDLHSLGEWFVHTQDVTRASGLHQPSPSPALEDALWRRVTASAAILRRGQGVVLERPSGERHQVGRGAVRQVVKGRPAELMMWVYGRESVAEVTVWTPDR